MKMRRVLSAFLAVICMITAIGFCTLGTSAEDTNPVYATTSASLEQGAYGYCYVYLDDLTELSALTVSVHYDTSKVTVMNSYNSVPCTVYDSSNKDGCLQFSYIFDGKGSNTKTQLFYFYYQINSTAEIGETYFDIIVSDALNSGLEVMNISGSRCAFTVTEKVVSKTCYVYSSSSVYTSVEEEFTLSYNLNTYSIASGSFEISYDRDLFELVELTTGGFLEGKLTDVNSELDGTVVVSFAGSETNYKNDLISVKFRTLKNTDETSEIKLTVKELHDLELVPISCSGYTTSVTLAFDESYTENSPSMTLSGSYSEDSDRVTLTVSLEAGSNLGAGDFTLSFDPSMLTYISSEKGFSPTFFTVNDKHAADGILKFSIISVTDITDAQTVLTLSFDAKRDTVERSVDFELTGSELTDSLGKTVLLNLVDTSVTVPKEITYTVSGTVTSFGSETDTVTVELIPEGQTNTAFTANISGNRAVYSFTYVPVGEYTLKVSKAGHLTVEKAVSVSTADITENIELVLGNNGKQFKINSANLVLSDNINVMYHVTVPDGFDDPRMVFTFNGENTAVTDYTVDDNGRYCYVFPGVNPQKIGDNICATLYATVGGVEVNVSVPTYSVRQYCVNQLNKTSDEAFKSLISDLLVYGEKAQIYQDYKTDALVTDGLSLTPSTYESLDGSYNKQQIIGTSDANVRYSSASLLLSNEISLQLGITTTDPTPYTFEVTINDRTDVYTSDDLEYKDGKYFLTFYGIKPSAFDDEITAIIKKDGVQISQTLKYSVHTYIQKNQNSQTEILRDLLRAIYNYGESARNFANKASAMK